MENKLLKNKLLKFIDEESHHSKWEEFRRRVLAGNVNEECSQLLKRMELDDSDDEIIPEEEQVSGDEELISLEDVGYQQITTQIKQVANDGQKAQKRKWGPTQRVDRTRRFPEDGRTMLQKAQDLKEKKDACLGKNIKTSFAFKSNSDLLQKANSVNISFGCNPDSVHSKIDSLKEKELRDRNTFEKNNPEVNLPGNLDVDVMVEDFPPLTKPLVSPLKDFASGLSQSWVEIASKSCEKPYNNSKNDRCILEH